jgi:hypothetical protein
MRLLAIGFCISILSVMAEANQCAEVFAPESFFRSVSQARFKLHFGGEDLIIVGDRASIQPDSQWSETPRSVLYIENVRVLIPGVNGLFAPARHRLRARDSSAVSDLCAQMTGGMFPYFHSDYNNQTTSTFLRSRVVHLGLLQDGQAYAEVTHEARSQNVYRHLICGQAPYNY